MKKKLTAIIIILCMAVSIIGTSAFAYAEKNVTVDGISMVLNSEYDASIIPSGFYEAAHEYEGETFYGGTDSQTNSIELFFIRCDSDERRTGWYTLEGGAFKLYQNLNGETSIDSPDAGSAEPAGPTGTITGSAIVGEAVTLQVAIPSSEVEIPADYSETTVAADNAYVTAYQKADAQGPSAEAFLVYGTLDGVNFGWYVYDQSQGTIQRFMNNAESQVVTQQDDIIEQLKGELSDLNDKYNNDIAHAKNLFIIACIIGILFLLLMINAMIKRKHTEKDLEDRIIDLKYNHGEETQSFTRSEQRHFDRLDQAAKDRADRLYEKSLGEDEYNFPEYGEKKSARKYKESFYGDENFGKNSKKTRKTYEAEDEFFDDDEEFFDEPKYRNGYADKRDSFFKSDETITLPRNEVKKAAYAGQPMTDPLTQPSERPERDVTMSAAGETSDFDLDLLEKNLGKMTSEVMNTPAPAKKPQRFVSDDFEEIKDDMDFDTDFIKL